MKRTFADRVLRSLLFIVSMNAAMIILCIIFHADFNPTLLGNVIFPVVCASVSFYGEDLRAKRLAVKKGQR